MSHTNETDTKTEATVTEMTQHVPTDRDTFGQIRNEKACSTSFQVQTQNTISRKKGTFVRKKKFKYKDLSFTEIEMTNIETHVIHSENNDQGSEQYVEKGGSSVNMTQNTITQSDNTVIQVDVTESGNTTTLTNNTIEQSGNKIIQIGTNISQSSDSEKLKNLGDESTNSNGIDSDVFKKYESIIRETVENSINKDGPKKKTEHPISDDRNLPHYWKCVSESAQSNTLASYVHSLVVSVDSITVKAIKKIVTSTIKFKYGNSYNGNDVSGSKVLKESFCPVQVVSVQRIENKNLFHDYDYERKRMRRLRSKKGPCTPIDKVRGSKGNVLTSQYLDASMKEDLYDDINEHYLFCGTDPSSITAIASNGLDPRVTNSVGGCSLYFAETSDTNTDWSKSRPSFGSQTMLLCRVTLGEAFLFDGNSNSAPLDGRNLKRPPCTNCLRDSCHCPNQQLYDSVINNLAWHFQPFVIYEKGRCYPEYIIKYNISCDILDRRYDNKDFTFRELFDQETIAKANAEHEKAMLSHVVKDSIRIMLIGKSRVGKTATSKMILNRKHLASEGDAYSRTATPEINFSIFKGREITVVDTPGFGDIKLKHKYVVEKTIKDIERAVAINQNLGFNAIIFVFRFGVEFTTEDVNTITILKHVLGKDFIHNHGVLLFTDGDALVEDISVSRKSSNFKEWLKSQTENNIILFLLEFGFRAILFNNAIKENSEQDIQIEELIEIIDSLSINGNRYTNNTFQNVQQDTQRLLTELNRKYVKDENLDKINCIKDTLRRIKINHQNYEEILLLLKKVESDADLLYVSLTEDDQKTVELEAAKKATECLIKLIKTKLNTLGDKRSKAIKNYEDMERINSYIEVLIKERENKLQKKREEEERIRQEAEEKRKKEEPDRLGIIQSEIQSIEWKIRVEHNEIVHIDWQLANAKSKKQQLISQKQMLEEEAKKIRQDGDKRINIQEQEYERRRRQEMEEEEERKKTKMQNNCSLM